MNTNKWGYEAASYSVLQGLFLKEILTGGEIVLNEDPDFLGRKAIEMMDYQTDLAPGIKAMIGQRLERSFNEK